MLHCTSQLSISLNVVKNQIFQLKMGHINREQETLNSRYLVILHMEEKL